MAWEIEFTEEAEAWITGLDNADYERIAAALDQLEEHGPDLGRPTVDSISGSRHSNMKELRSRGGHLRALFAFDLNREAIVLVGGDKSGQWKKWYRVNIPVADDRYDAHLKGIEAERGAGK